MPPMAIKGASVAYVVVGGMLVYSGIKGATISATAKSVLSGNLNVTDTEGLTTGASTASASASTGGDTGAADAGAASNQALAKQLAIQMGYSTWTTGQAWDDWVSLWNKESGWNIAAANPTSDARGIAQNINGYSSSYQQGNATSQITWGINYIAGRYGSPVMAWAHEQSNNWY
jgi:resuscitation-promoting factor RpfB